MVDASVTSGNPEDRKHKHRWLLEVDALIGQEQLNYLDTQAGMIP